MKIHKSASLIVAMAFANFIIVNEAVATAHHKAADDAKSVAATTEHSTPTKKSRPVSTKTIATKSTAEKIHKEKKSTVNPATQTPQTASTTAATAAVNNSFKSWSSNRSEITPHDIVTQLKNPRIKNIQEAATLGAIADTTNGMTTWNPSSLSSINQSLKKYGVTDAFPATSYNKDQVLTENGFTVTLKPVKGSHPQTYTTEVTFTKAQLDYDLSNPDSAMYKHYTASLENLNASIASNGTYNMGYSTSAPLTSNTLIKQGPVGDCYFVSAVNGILETNPGAIQSKNTPDKRHQDWYWVKFPGAKLPILVKLTPAEIASASSVQGGGVWFAVLSNGEAQYRETHGGSLLRDLKNRSEGSLDMLHGGTEDQTFPLLNGKPYQVVKLNSESSTSIANGFQKMVAGESQMPNNPGFYPINPPVGIATSGHALLIIGYNPTTQNFIIKNPWGSTGYYNPPSMGFKAIDPTTQPAQGNWISMTDGVFALSLAGVYSNEFVGITIPTSAVSDFQ